MGAWSFLAGLAVAGAASAQPAQRAAQQPSAPAVRWTIVAPDAAIAWYAVVADLRVPGRGALPFTRPGPRATPSAPALAAALGNTRESELLHFGPLYHPSADRAALAAALRAAAEGRPAPVPRANLLVGALTQGMSAPLRRARLPEFAALLERAEVRAPEPALLRGWQRALDSLWLPALAPWLAAERLDEGRLVVAPGIGAEGRLFAATADRRDNLAAVGTFAGDPDPEAPLLAFAREACYPAVSRAVRAARLPANDATARRASLAAVRCGAALVDARLPARGAAYRAFWMRRLAESGGAARPPAAQAPAGDAALRDAFDRAFPTDPALTAPAERDIARLGTRP